MKLQPENHFAHTLDTVTALGNAYGIPVASYQEATSGIENTTLIVTSKDVLASKYVFRIYRRHKKTDQQIQAELDFMTYLGAHGIPVPRVIANKQAAPLTNFVAAGHSWQVIVMAFVAGEHPQTASDILLTTIATTQARMHQLAAGYSYQSGSIRTFSTLVEQEFIPQIDPAKLNPQLQDFIHRGATYHVLLDANLPTGPCHLDYDEQNMLCQDNTITAVLDFDDMAVVPYALCLAYTLWHVQNHYGRAALDTYLAAYQHIRPLTKAEQQFLPTAMLFRHYVITAIKILNGQTSPSEVAGYLSTEQQLATARTL